MEGIKEYYKKVCAAADFISGRLKETPTTAVLTGTGLSGMNFFPGDSLEIDFAEIPGFPLPTVVSHRGKLIFGKAAGISTVVLAGRLHLYEGHTPYSVVFPIRVMKELGVKRLILTNAAGGLNECYNAGDLMIISDHINMTGENPLLGEPADMWGPRFPDMSCVWDPDLRKTALSIAARHGTNCHEGIYAGLKGPSLETPAEVRMLRRMGADAVGFSTVMEAIAARHQGTRLIGISAITNVHDPKNPVPASVDEIIDVAQRCAVKMGRLIFELISTQD